MKNRTITNKMLVFSKKATAVFLCALMILTAWVFVAPQKAKAASVKSSSVFCDDLTFIVPEVIYLYPNATAQAVANVGYFQWYANNTTNGSVNSTYSSTGLIYYNYSGASSATLSYSFMDESLSSVLDGGSITVNSTTLSSGSSYSITAGTSPSLAASTTGCYVQWCLSFTDSKDNVSKKAYAYSYVYKPYTIPIAAGADGGTGSSGANWAGSVVWINGFNTLVEQTCSLDNDWDDRWIGYYTNMSNFSAFVSPSDTAVGSKGYVGTTQVTGVKYNSGSGAGNSGVGSYKYTASGYSTGYAVFGNSSSQGYYLQKYSNSNPSGYASNSSGTYRSPARNYNAGKYRQNSKNIQACVVTQSYGKIYIDASRYNNLNQIPNVGIGLIVTDDENSGSNTGTWYIADYSENTRNCNGYTTWHEGADNRSTYYNDYNYKISGQGTSATDTSNNESEGLRYAGAWPRTLMGATATQGGTQMYMVKGFYGNADGGWYASSHTVAKMQAVYYNKSNLRTAVLNAIKKMPALGVNGISSGSITSTYFDSNTNYKWTALQEAYKAAVIGLTKLDYSSNPDTLATNLNSALNALCTKVNFDSNGGTLSSTTAVYVVIGTNQTASYSPTYTGSRTGYEFDGWATSKSASSGSKSVTVGYNNTLYAIWSPHTYTVAYDGNGATGGSTRSSSHTYDTAKNLTTNGFTRSYTVSYNANGGTVSTSSNTATATFNGWATSASGSKEYNNSQSVQNLTTTNGATVNLYANWTLGSVTLPTPTKDSDSSCHYTFNGWYDKDSDGNKIGNAGASYTPTENKTLFAQWTATAHTYTSTQTKAPTCTTAGTTKYTCECGYNYSDSTTPAKLGHNYDYANASFNWSGFDCVTATVKCKRDTSHTVNKSTTVSGAITTEPTYDVAGVKTYTASFNESSKTYSSTKTDSIPALQTLINLDDIAIEDIENSGSIALAPTKESDISFEIEGFVANGGSHTLYKAASKPTAPTKTLKLDGVRISKASDGAGKLSYKFTKMDFSTLPSFYALVKVTGTGSHKWGDNVIYTYQKITLVPPKNVFFDDTAEAITYSNSENANSGFGIWSRITDENAAASEATDSFGDIATAQSSADNSVKFSFGDAHKVSVSNTLDGRWPTAKFTFTGSGFDLISVTDGNSGVFVVKVYQGTDTTVQKPFKSKVVDNYYGYTYTQLYYNTSTRKIVDSTGGDSVLYSAVSTTPEESRVYAGIGEKFYTMDTEYATKDKNAPVPAYGWLQSKNSDVLYQVPCISMDLETVGTYTVVVEPRFTTRFGHFNENGDTKYYNLVLDGVRIYNPADGSNEALAKYAENGETFTRYDLIRDSKSLVDSYIVIDGITPVSNSSLKSYLDGAPNNELYLAKNGTAAFDIDASKLNDARLGLKAINGKPCSVTITGKADSKPIELTLNSATEKYVSLKSILDLSGTTTVTVTNNGEGMLSLTKLMSTSDSSLTGKTILKIGAKTTAKALAAIEMLNSDLAIDEVSINVEPAKDGTVVITLETSTDAEMIVILDENGNTVEAKSVDFSVDESGVKHWTVVLVNEAEDEYTYTLQAQLENGYTAGAEPVTVTVTVPTKESEISVFAKSPLGSFFMTLIDFIQYVISLIAKWK